MDLHIRRYRPADYAAVMKLHYDGVAQIDPEGHGVPSSYDNDLDDIPANYLNVRGDFLVGELHGEIVAIGALRPRTETCGEIKRMRTRRSLQGTGYGRQILARLTERAVELGYTELFLDTLPDNTQARRFYEKAGFVESGSADLGRFSLTYYRKKLSP